MTIWPWSGRPQSVLTLQELKSGRYDGSYRIEVPLRHFTGNPHVTRITRLLNELEAAMAAAAKWRPRDGAISGATATVLILDDDPGYPEELDGRFP